MGEDCINRIKEALRVRGTMYAKFDAEHWALADGRPPGAADIRIDDGGESASIRNGDIVARMAVSAGRT